MARSDAELTRAVLDGDVEQFRGLVERHQDAVFRIAMRCTQDTESATEIAQEAFVRAYEHLDRLYDPGYFYGWLRQIAINLCTDWLRARNGRTRSLNTLQEQGFDVGIAGSQPRVSPVEATIHRKNVKETVLREIGNLPPDFQQVLLMHYYESMSMEEIGNTLNIKVNTVKVRLFRARSALRPRLKRLYQEGELTSEGLSVRPI